MNRDPESNGLLATCESWGSALFRGDRWAWAISTRGGSPTLGEGAAGGTERAKRSGGLHKRSAEDWGDPLRRAIGAAPLSVLSTSVTKQTGDMVYSGARRLRILGIWAHTTMLYALERDSDHGSTFAVSVELPEG